MKTSYPFILLACSITCLTLMGCKKKGDVWNDNNTANRYSTDRSLWGNAEGQDGLLGPNDEDFIPLKDEDLKSQFADGAIPQSSLTPGEAGSGLPSIDYYKMPTGELVSVFHTVYFNTDDHILRGREYLNAIENMAAFLKAHPNTYVFIEGHCDERGPEAYNLSLGSRRANYVRTLLVKQGVNLDQIHTVSYGKEKPVVMGTGPEAWAKNRRAQFKIYQKS